MKRWHYAHFFRVKPYAQYLICVLGFNIINVSFQRDNDQDCQTIRLECPGVYCYKVRPVRQQRTLARDLKH